MKKSLFALATLVLAAGTLHAESATYKIDPNHTKAMFEVKHFGTSTNRGRWDKTEGEISLDKAAKTGKADITIDMASINTGIGAFNDHLKGVEFFDVATHPTAKFVGDKFTFAADKVTEVAGNLTIRGKTHPAVLKATNFNCYENPKLKREVCGGDFETVIKRSAFDINWGIADRAAADDIKVTIQAEAIKQQ
ncbi:MAG: YceI family protein [Polaromonas sp.]